MILIYDQASIDLYPELIRSFQEIYDKGFPDADERENFDDILQRVAKELPNQPHTVMAICEIGQHEAKGGLITDCYAGSKAMHLTYLIVDKCHQKQGVGKELISNGIQSLIELVKRNKNIEILNVFFESNNPFKTSPDDEYRFDRLRIFSGHGAKLINIPYVQPALDKNKKPVDYLLLFSFTQFNKNGDHIHADHIKHFLKEFCLSLDVDDKDPVLVDMHHCVDRIKNEDQLVKLEPLSELPKYHFGNASVTWHYMERLEGSTDLAKETSSEKESCHHFFSFETDLFNYQKQKNRPFSTIFYKYYSDVELLFPSFYGYTSEGSSHVRLAPAAVKKIRLSVSFTRVGNNGERMFHLTFAPALGESFSELDIIKLSNPFASKQEDSHFEEPIRIKIGDEKTTVNDFLASLDCCCKDAVYTNQGAGIVQIDIQNSSIDKTMVNTLLETVENSNRKALSENLNLMEFSKALCGIILGIYDYDRMKEEEIFDTIIPISAGSDSFHVAHRGLLFQICRDDDIVKLLKQDIIVPPYMLIPNFVLTYNDHVLNNAMKMLDEILEESEKRNLSDLENKHIEISSILNNNYLQDIFQYPSEKEIIECGNEQRGIKNTYTAVFKRLELLSEIMTKKREERTNRSNALLNALLVLIPLLQLLTLLPDGVRYRWWIFVFAGFCGLVAWLIYRRLSGEHHRKRGFKRNGLKIRKNKIR